MINCIQLPWLISLTRHYSWLFAAQFSTKTKLQGHKVQIVMIIIFWLIKLFRKPEFSLFTGLCSLESAYSCVRGWYLMYLCCDDGRPLIHWSRGAETTVTQVYTAHSWWDWTQGTWHNTGNLLRVTHTTVDKHLLFFSVIFKSSQ